MKFMRSNLAFVLMLLNLTITGLILYFSLVVNASGDLTILILDSVAIFFIILLIVSFCLNDNECWSKDEKINKNFPIGSCFGACTCCPSYIKCNCDIGKFYDCNKYDCGDSLAECCGMFIFYIVFIIVFSILLLIILSIGAAGKHNIRVFSSIALFLLDLAMAVMSLLIILKEIDIYAILILSLSIFMAICNISSIALPNVDYCFFLSFEYQLQDNKKYDFIDYVPPQNITKGNDNQDNNSYSKKNFENEYIEKPYYDNNA